MKKLILFAALLAIFSTGCNKDEDSDNTFNIFSVDDDIAFGAQFAAELNNNQAEFPVLDPIQYAETYWHVNRIRDSILSSGKLKYADRFAWEVKIIHDDEVLNAFAVPGGHLYVYTGIIKFFENEAEFAGVMGHEMAHADRRHSTDQLTKAYGVQLLFAILLGNSQNQIAVIAANMAAGLSSLAFSRDNEYEADEYAVKYLNETSYDPRGPAYFFEKLMGSPEPPQFLSTHPNHENRVNAMFELWESLGAKEGDKYADSYADFKATLP